MAEYTSDPRLGLKFGEALVFTNRWHLTQVRKDLEQTPYISHLLAVASMVLERGGDEDVAIAALLHDTVEDTECLPEYIEDMFGEEVLKIVLELSEDKSLSKLERKKAYAKSVEFMSEAAVLVSYCDKLHNLQSYCKSPELFGDFQKEFYQDLIPEYDKRILNVNEMESLFNKLVGVRDKRATSNS